MATAYQYLWPNISKSHNFSNERPAEGELRVAIKQREKIWSIDLPESNYGMRKEKDDAP